jgi:hypothetical protein
MRTVTLTIDEYEQKMLRRLIGTVIENTINRDANIAPRVGTGLEYELLLDLLKKVTYTEVTV